MGAASFFQSSEFGEFQEKIPYRGKSWIVKKWSKKKCHGELVESWQAEKCTLRQAQGDISQKGDENLCLIVRQKLKFGKSFLWVPYGPQIEDPEKLKSVFEDLQRIAREENAIFARIEPGNISLASSASSVTVSPPHSFIHSAPSLATFTASTSITPSLASSLTPLTLSGVHELFMKCSRKVCTCRLSKISKFPKSQSRVHEMFMKCSCAERDGREENAEKCSCAEEEEEGVGGGENAEKCGKWARGKLKLAPERFTPETTLVLDLTLSEEEILKQMKPKGRYNIKVAEKNGVDVVRYDNADKDDARDCFAPRLRSGLAMTQTSDLEDWYEILRNTAARDGFHCHPKFFYEEFLKFFGEKKMTSLFVARHGAKVIAGILVVWHGDTAIYYYGASSYEHRNLMAPYLLHFEALKEAKKRGFHYYDFFGIAPENVSNHPWKGVTEFKKKFGGKTVQYAPAFDIVYRPFWYAIYRLKQKFS